MVTISDRPLGRTLRFEPLPPLVTPEELLADSLPLLDPPSRITVTDAAERSMRVEVQGVWQNFDRDVTPYMVEPTNSMQSRLYKSTAVVAPSQSGKTKALEAGIAHLVTCDQSSCLVIHMDRPNRDKWVEAKLNPTINQSPVLFERLGKGRDDSTFSRKRFKGMGIEIAYPTPQNLSGGTYARVLMTDLDHMPVVLGTKESPEGSPYRMARQRTKSFLSRGCVFVESTPAHPVIDPDWTPDPLEPHALPPVRHGIVPIYNEGTRGRWYWECPDCAGLFEPLIERLHYDDSLEPGEAGRSAGMECPHCGSLLAHKHKIELNRRALRGHGGWFHEGVDGQIYPFGDSSVRPTDIASYCLDGAAATFANWADIVASLEAAKRKAEQFGDEADLSQVYYTDIGKPYASRSSGSEKAVTRQVLKDASSETPRGVLPAWTCFVTVSVDVQKAYFPVQVTAWGADSRAQIVDRLDLATPVAEGPDAPERRLDPAKNIEDWKVLEPLETRVWPVEGPDYGLRAIGLVVDFQGEAGVSDNAEAFWRARNRDGAKGRWYLSRGRGGFDQPRRVWLEAPERGSKGKRARSIKLLNMATDRLKDTISVCLSRIDGERTAFKVGSWMTDDEIDEAIAEVRSEKGWVKKPGVARNETFDLCVQARAVAEIKGLNKVDPQAPPRWALNSAANTWAVANDDGEEEPVIERKRKRTAPKNFASKYLRRP